jgi:ATPase subunit of ABC transporter with duplicated ATPase domains
LLGALLGRVPLFSGSAMLGPGVRVGEIDQTRELFLGGEPLLRAFGANLPEWPESEVWTLLAKFGLTAAHVPRPAASLSPGERTRAALALLQARGSTCWCSTSRQTILICPPSNSWNPRWSPIRARCCS